MRVKHHYFYVAKNELIRFLEKNKLPYEICDLPETNDKLCTFDLYEDQEFYCQFKKRFFYLPKSNSIRTIEYSKQEIENAEWLIVRSIGTKVQWEYNEDAFQRTCPYKRLFIKKLYYRHSIQVDILSASKTIKWGTKQYFSGPNSADDFLFCSEKAKELLGDGWEGLEFWPIRKCNSTKYIDNLYQMIFKEYLPIEAILGGSVTQCKDCGKKIMRFFEGTHNLIIKKEYLNNSFKVFRINDVLTEQAKDCTTFSLNIVSQEFYKYCEANQMNRGMIYEPIKLI